MKKKILLILLVLFLPLKVFAAGGFGVSTTSISMYPGESKTVTITTSNAVGKLNISTSNSGVASVSPGSVFIQNPGSNASITIKGNAVGTSTISVVASNDFATMDEEILAGQTKTITVKVVARPTQPSNNNNNNTNNTNTNTDTRSKNNNIKEISVEGYKLVKVDNTHYTLSVPNNVSSINVKATAEDSKAKVTGTGNRNINVGENNIDVTVTAENGSQRKINIKVNRKDSYYLEDLDIVLKDSKIEDANITIKSDTIITSQDLQKIKSSKKIVKFNFYNDSKNIIYSWIIDGSKINNTDDLLTTISNESNNKDNVLKSSNYADGIFVNLKQAKDLPAGTKLKIYVADKYKNNDLVNIYVYLNNDNKLELLKSNNKVENGYIEFELKNGTDYLLTMSNIPTLQNVDVISNDSSNNFIVPILILIIVILIMVIIIIVIKNKRRIIYDKKTIEVISNNNDQNQQL